MAPRTLPNIRHQAGTDLQIIGPTSYLDNYFQIGSFTPVAAVAPELVTESVNSHVRKRYPGDIGTNVSAHARVKLVGGTEDGSSATPGRRFWCERPSGTGPLRKSNAVQFTYIGTWKALRTFAQQNMAGANFILRNSSGESVEIID
jgi:hypothetical protein